MELSKSNGKLKEEIENLKKEKKEVENAISIIEVTEVCIQLSLIRLYTITCTCVHVVILNYMYTRYKYKICRHRCLRRI